MITRANRLWLRVSAQVYNDDSDIERLGNAVDEVLAAGPDKVGRAFYEKNRQWKEKGATPLELGRHPAQPARRGNVVADDPELHGVVLSKYGGRVGQWV